MTVKTEGREDKVSNFMTSSMLCSCPANFQEIAEETWMKYLLRNKSVVVREFQGQLKSTLVCPDCKGISKIFDPFMFLSLPLPIKKTRTLYVSVVKTEPSDPIIKVRIKLMSNE